MTNPLLWIIIWTWSRFHDYYTKKGAKSQWGGKRKTAARTTSKKFFLPPPYSNSFKLVSTWSKRSSKGWLSSDLGRKPLVVLPLYTKFCPLSIYKEWENETNAIYPYTRWGLPSPKQFGIHFGIQMSLRRGGYAPPSNITKHHKPLDVSCKRNRTIWKRDHWLGLLDRRPF